MDVPAAGRQAPSSTAHRLEPLLNARSLAVLGASERAGSFGLRLAQAVKSAGYAGQVDFINPRYTTILGSPCRAALADLDTAPDLVMLGVGARNLEQSLLDAIRIGAGSAVIFDACHGEAMNGQPLLPRLRSIAREAGIPVCGGAGMGLINVETGCVASFYGAARMQHGGITLIAHSGSVFTTLAMNDPRYQFDLLVSPGQEIGATVDEYIDFALGRSTTKVIAVFMESARNPDGFKTSLLRARNANVPVVVCKVGNSEESARMARSHTGALSGSGTAYRALLEECGAIQVDTVDQLMNVALLCSTGRRPGRGGVGLVTDSGGLRELMIDLAAGTPAILARLSDTTRARLRAILPPNLDLSNPLDCGADLTEDFAKPFEQAVEIFASAEEISMIGYEADLRDDYVYDDRIRDLAMTLARRTDKPCFFYSSFARTNNTTLGQALIAAGVPCINGASEMLAAVARLQHWSDFGPGGGFAPPQSLPPDKIDHWAGLLAGASEVDEHLALSLLSDFGLQTARGAVQDSWGAVRQAAAQIGYPVVLKTAEPGIAHKSDQGGVLLDIQDEAALAEGYGRLSLALGPRVILQPMVAKGVELAFGFVRDPDFGPLVMLSAGGVLIEHFADRAFALAPVSEGRALELINRLQIARLLDGARGAPACDKASVARAFATFSAVCAGLGTVIAEADVNPVIVTPGGTIAVDALLVTERKPGQR
ncbi:MAG: acetate--CoA ligase family protein [Rhodobacteraceae bacterium]|nr:acetate--CoA ligase family protein [Paracoccaceae bacterium]